jgi:NDP-sugar pyrophosphorylase family protein
VIENSGTTLKSVKGLFLAAGRGSRMKGAVEKGLLEPDTPKAFILATAEKKPIIKLLLDVLPKQMALALVTNPQYVDIFKEKLPEMDIIDIGGKGAVVDLLASLDKLKWWEEEAVVVLPSDTLVNFVVEEFIYLALAKNAFVTVGQVKTTKEIENTLGCFLVEDSSAVNKITRVTGFSEKPPIPPSNIAAVPFYVLPKKTLEFINNNRDKFAGLDAPGKLIEKLLELKHEVFVYVTDEDTADIGREEDLIIADEFQSQPSLV